MKVEQIKIEKPITAKEAAVLVEKANQFNSEIFLQHGNKKINAKSIMGTISLGLKKDTEILLAADGGDEEVALAEMIKAFK